MHHHTTGRTLLRRAGVAAMRCMVAACGSVRPVYNAELGSAAQRPGYRLSALPPTAHNGNELFVTAGGGARAAALAYGVLEAMRDTEVEMRSAPCPVAAWLRPTWLSTARRCFQPFTTGC